VEASALQAPAGLARNRVSIGLPLLRLRSDEQLVALFRGGNEEAFRVIHDRYRQRLFAYTRQMLSGSRLDAEDALQDVFVRAYASLRANNRELALRAWLYRVAHNRCIDELRRPPLPAHDVIECARLSGSDPIAEAERRETLRRLIEDVRRLPEQQRSALLMRELSGMSYAELAAALGVSVPAVKSLLVRARIGLAKALEARETACSAIREDLVVAHDRGVRPSGTVRRHLRDCEGCCEFRGEVRGFTRQFAALVPALGPAGMLAKLVGIGGGAGGGAAAGGSAAVAGGAAGTGGVLTAGGLLATGASHVATLLAAAVITAGGAVEMAKTIAVPVKHHSRHHLVSIQAPTVTAGPVTAPPAVLRAVDQVTGSVSAGAPAAAPLPPSTVTQRHAHPRPRPHTGSGAASLPTSLDQGNFGLPPYSPTADGSPSPPTGTGPGSGALTGDGTTGGGTTGGASGTAGYPVSESPGDGTGANPGSSPATLGTESSGPAATNVTGTGPSPSASTASAGASSSGMGSAPTGTANAGAPSSSTG
jgi:RNA polymerase sigma factor (sigma-70 family)